ncbi:hypothetical protein PIB30_048478 [Stylosanthes scabra]|uniref:Uncharacterized protein n=1 Tax=Stylosanthes scabra TaxID=79078 RepID=A0ABU6QGE6_9FABA|nr:hypothetical protein [Stylosanthes scabra]
MAMALLVSAFQLLSHPRKSSHSDLATTVVHGRSFGGPKGRAASASSNRAELLFLDRRNHLGFVEIGEAILLLLRGFLGKSSLAATTYRVILISVLCSS